MNPKYSTATQTFLSLMKNNIKKETTKCTGKESLFRTMRKRKAMNFVNFTCKQCDKDYYTCDKDSEEKLCTLCMLKM